MKNASRIAAVLFTIVLCISMLGAVFIIAEHTHHDCTGENCAVCAVLEQCDQRVRGAVSAVIAVIALFLFAQYIAPLNGFEIREASGETPVSLKVKLLN